MARPTDPEKLAALRARQAENSRNYRKRKAEERARTRPAVPQKRQTPATEAAVVRAHEQRAQAQARRNEVISQLPSARNPRVNIYTPRPPETAPATIPETEARRRQRIKVIKENTEAKKLQNIGRRRKVEIGDTLAYDTRAKEIRSHLESAGGEGFVHRFKDATRRIGGVSQQALAIFLQYEGGEGDLQSALTQIAYPGKDDGAVEDALERIESLAEYAERANTLYGPSAVGRLRI